MSSHRARLLRRRRAGARRSRPAASSATSPAATPRFDRSPLGSARPHHTASQPRLRLTYLRAVQEAHHAFASMDMFFFFSFPL